MVLVEGPPLSKWTGVTEALCQAAAESNHLTRLGSGLADGAYSPARGARPVGRPRLSAMEPGRAPASAPPPFVRVAPALFLGSARAAGAAELLSRAGITLCVNVSRQQPDPCASSVTVLRVPVFDDPAEDLFAHLESTCAAMETAVRAGGACLVYCKNGRSRSAAVCTAFLMRHRGLNLAQAFEAVKRARPVAEPNPGFWSQLQRFEDQLRSQTPPGRVLPSQDRPLEGADNLWAQTQFPDHPGPEDPAVGEKGKAGMSPVCRGHVSHHLPMSMVKCPILWTGRVTCFASWAPGAESACCPLAFRVDPFTDYGSSLTVTLPPELPAHQPFQVILRYTSVDAPAVSLPEIAGSGHLQRGQPQPPARALVLREPFKPESVDSGDPGALVTLSKRQEQLLVGAAEPSATLYLD
ncbi:PREDICTED: uncharacterized protein LOC102858378 [Elephantulus edwardii]|uniref:uncharacterized protein LOC102858378 n=1 Tax=Elephantulus edwardii TaxID=28737 RepID=UPI0003F098C4|nr:PREDICTED: uncharacterized protein LOC102858378 [Elephantulus edwardii]